MDADQGHGPNYERKKYTGKRLVVLKDSSSYQSINDQAKEVSLRFASSKDYPNAAEGYYDAFRDADGIVFESFGIAVVNETHEEQVHELTTSERSKTTFLYSEPERFVYASNGRRASLWQKIKRLLLALKASRNPLSFEDDAAAYWGVHAVKALSSDFSGKGVKLAILDTGFNLNHPDFKGRNLVSESFISGESVDDLNGHGTHCTGIATSGRNQKNNSRYGVAREASIYAGKVLSNDGVGTDSSILAGLEWALINQCKVVSMSLGASISEGEGYSKIYNDLAKKLMDKGMLLIAAAGNDSNRTLDLLKPVNHPANCPNIMAIGALDKKLRIADFSAAGLHGEGGEVDIAAPGVQVFSSYKSPENYRTLNGTSMATPFVSGLAALLWEEFPNAGPLEIWEKLQQNAFEIPLPARDVGAGLAQINKK